MKVQILKCNNRKWTVLGFIIKSIQQTNYSHYAIGYTSHTGEYMILDATSKNVALRSTTHFLSHYTVVDTKTVDLAFSYDDFCTWYEPLLGMKYGYAQLIGILVHSKTLGFGVVCNELVLRLLKRFTTFDGHNIDIMDLNDTNTIVEEYSL